MATGHSMLDMLNQQSKAGVQDTPKARFRTKDIEITKMYRNEENFYSIREIEELAYKIQASGMMENLVVVYAPCDDGDYRLVSGERRWLALQLLVSWGYTEFGVATCQVRPARSKAEEKIDIITANAHRTKTVGDILREERELKESLEELRAGGKTLNGVNLNEGRLRDHIAKLMKISSTKAGQIEAINNNLSLELRAKVEAGEITFSAAYEAAALPQERQQEIAEALEAGEDVTHADVKAEKQKNARERAAEIYNEQECKITGAKCYHGESLASHMKDGNIEGCAGCCACCKRAKPGECDVICEEVLDMLASANEEELARQEIEEAAAAAPPPAAMFEAHPDHIESMCYSCLNWDSCTERSDKVFACDVYANSAEKPDAPPAPVKDAQITDERAVEEIRRAIDLSVAGSAALRCHTLLSAMWERWNETGGWENEQRVLGLGQRRSVRLP